MAQPDDVVGRRVQRFELARVERPHRDRVDRHRAAFWRRRSASRSSRAREGCACGFCAFWKTQFWASNCDEAANALSQPLLAQPLADTAPAASSTQATARRRRLDMETLLGINGSVAGRHGS